MALFILFGTGKDDCLSIYLLEVRINTLSLDTQYKNSRG
jgi:hypothetical protein